MLTEWIIHVSTVHDPLDEDHGHEISKDTQEEHKLGYELEKDLVVLLLAKLVPETQHHTKGHVDHSKDQRDLHLVGIKEPDLVCGRVPKKQKMSGILNLGDQKCPRL